jgi:hypothetical protein
MIHANRESVPVGTARMRDQGTINVGHRCRCASRRREGTVLAGIVALLTLIERPRSPGPVIVLEPLSRVLISVQLRILGVVEPGRLRRHARRPGGGLSLRVSLATRWPWRRCGPCTARRVGHEPDAIQGLAKVTWCSAGPARSPTVWSPFRAASLSARCQGRMPETIRIGEHRCTRYRRAGHEGLQARVKVVWGRGQRNRQRQALHRSAPEPAGAVPLPHARRLRSMMRVFLGSEATRRPPL